MRKYSISEWINSAGGPFVVMEEEKASLWQGLSGDPSDFDLACQTSDYIEKLSLHDTEILVLGDEPLQTAIATSDNQLLIVRWKWAESESDVQDAIEKIDLKSVRFVEELTINLKSQFLVLFDSVDTFYLDKCLRFTAHKGDVKVSTFIWQPSSTTSLLVHSITSI